MINLDKYESIGSHWIDFYVNVKNATYFDNLELNIFQKIRKFIGNKTI